MALERRGRIEPIDGLASVTAPHDWLVVAAVMAVLALLVGWALLGSVERTVTAACVAMHPGERVAVVAPAAGVVSEQIADVGDRVTAGQPLVRVALPELAAEIALARARAAALAAEGTDEQTPPPLGFDSLAFVEALEAQRDAGELVVSPADGRLARLDAQLGDALQAGARIGAVLLPQADADIAATALLDERSAARVRPSMAASVRLRQGARRASAEHLASAFVTAVDVDTDAPAWLTDGPDGPDSSERAAASTAARLVFDVDAALPWWVREGTECDARIVIERQRPIEVLVPMLGAAGRG